MNPAGRARRRRGNELIEFSLVASLLLPVLFGTFVLGMNLSRSIQVTQLSRDTGHMYARNLDLADTSNRQIILRLARGLDITDRGGSGVIVLSTVMFIGQAQCDAAGLTSTQCTNRDQNVVVHRIVIGDASARASAFGTPSPALIDSTGKVSHYLTDTTTRAAGFGALLTLAAGEVAYVAEVWVPSPDYAMPGYQATGVYSRTIF
jgi:Flp pilus assembly protein TadG